MVTVRRRPEPARPAAARRRAGTPPTSPDIPARRFGAFLAVLVVGLLALISTQNPLVMLPLVPLGKAALSALPVNESEPE